MTLPRVIDIAVATAAAAALMPVVAVATIGVAIDLGWPVLFVQPRSGRGGRVFKMAKLRSMREARDAKGQSLPDEARVSGFGRFLRRSRIDELPGLWHVIVGDISLVGPRPLLPATIAAMGAAGAARGTVRPGLTGWAQVNGNALLTDADKLALDIWYINNASPWLDMVILVRTIGVVIGGERINSAQLGKAYAGDHRRDG
jgi:lipopolysaccharide/colanic/teichoic acid biosynthesis glycosyltransferase